MNVIFDENKAIQKKKEMDDALPETNRAAKIHNAIWALPTISFVILISILWVWLAVELNLFDNFIAGYLGVPFVLAVFAWGSLYCNWEPTFKPGENYPALVLYYLATINKTVLDHKLISCQDDFWNGKKAYTLKVVLEDKEHKVTEYKLPILLYPQTRTDVMEITVDLENRAVYEPYEGKKD